MRRTARVLVALTTICGCVALAPPEVGAATPQAESLSSHAQSVKTSTGKSLRLQVEAYKTTASSSTDKVQLSVNLSTGWPYGNGETHTWRFLTARSDFTYSPSTGKGSVTTGKEIEPFGSISLSFAKTGQTTTCYDDGIRVTDVKGTLHGKVSFDTRLSAWGHVSDSSFTFSTPNVISLTSGCRPKRGQFDCSVTTTYDTNTIPAEVIGNAVTVSGSTTSTISGDRTVTLPKPRYGGRVDFLQAAEPAPSISGSTLNITTKPHTAISGSATISGGQASTTSLACTHNGHRHTEHVTSYDSGDASWSSPSGLTFNFRAVPDLVSATDGSASWSRSTYN